MFTRSLAGTSLVIAIAVMLALPLAGICDGGRLAIGDVISVTVEGEKDFTGLFEVGADGGIVLPMGIKSVKVEGMSATDAAAVVTKALTKVLKDPHVTVNFTGRAKMQVNVLGQVKKRGLIEVGVGDKVLVLTEGSSSRTLLGNEMAPVYAVIVGVIDEVDVR